MKPLATSQRVLIWMFMCTPNESTSSTKKSLYLLFLLAILCGNIGVLISCFAFFIRYVSIDLEQSLHPVMNVGATFGVVYACIYVACFERNKMCNIFKKLSIIYDSQAIKDTFRFLAQANNKSEWLWSLYFKLMIYAIVSSIFMSSTSVFFYWMETKSVNVDFYYHPYKMILPWNQTTFLGYSVEIAFTIYQGQTYMISNGVLLLFFISKCYHHQAFYSMFKHSVAKLEQSDANQSDKRLLCDLIQFHVSIRDWFLESTDAFSPLVGAQLLSSMIILATAVFQIDLQLKHMDSSLLMLLIAIMLGISTLYFYCYFGKLATESFMMMSDCLFESNWQDLRIDLQKCFILMIKNAQRPLFYHGSKIATLNLETFTSMLKTVMSYYLMFKTITSN